MSDRSRRGTSTRSDFIARLIVAIPAGAAAIAVIIAGGAWFAAVLGALGLVCIHELFAMFDVARPSRLAGFIGVAGVLVAAALGDMQDVMMAFMAAVVVVFLLVTRQPAGGGAPAISVTTLGITWIGLALAHAVLLRRLEHGDTLIFAVALGTFLGDTAAYLGGRAFGRTRLAPAISPNKTVEGLLAGIVVCIGTVWYVGLSNGTWMGGQRGALLGLAVAVAAPLGDLFESYLKRDAGTKDTGTLFGPHGGALDRIDAVMFAAVAGFYTWLAVV